MDRHAESRLGRPARHAIGIVRRRSQRVKHDDSVALAASDVGTG
jgi:hypothetical protein